ncbi:MAG: hypothetical protein SNH73_01100 [Rikenellaceae bacterium]
MKNLKIKTVSAALLLSIFTMSASAQQQRKAPRGGERPTAEKIAEIATDKLDQKLDLTDSQESKILAINLKYAQLRAESKPERAEHTKGTERPSSEEAKAKMEAMKAQRASAEEQKKAQMLEIMKVLSDEQKVEYALLIGNSKGQKGPRSQHNQRGQRGQSAKRSQGGQSNQGGKGGQKMGQQPQNKRGQQAPRE